MHPFRRGASSITSEVLAQRLDRLAGQWLRPSSPAVGPRDPDDLQGPGEPPARELDDSVAGNLDGPAEAEVDRAVRLLLPDRASLRAVLLVVVLAALVVGWMWWQGRPRPVVPAPQAIAESVALSSGQPTVGEVVVHVTGSVKAPGVVRLPAGSRVEDAIRAAGGARSPKALDSVNLARILVDGEQIVVGATPTSAAGGSADAGINLNQATASQLEELPGVGPVLAQRIVQWRTANGPFRSVEELGEVSGIGDALLSQIRAIARV